MSMFKSSIMKSKYLAEYGAYVFLRTFLRILPFNFMMTKGDRIGGWGEWKNHLLKDNQKHENIKVSAK